MHCLALLRWHGICEALWALGLSKEKLEKRTKIKPNKSM
jgi:hypothetical protein